jgi:hypothetical protein
MSNVGRCRTEQPHDVAGDHVDTRSWGESTFSAGVAGRCAIGGRQTLSGACVGRRRAEGDGKDGGSATRSGTPGRGLARRRRTVSEAETAIERHRPLGRNKWHQHLGRLSDGVSLTVNEVSGTRFGVNIIPHTLARTSFTEEMSRKASTSRAGRTPSPGNCACDEPRPPAPPAGAGRKRRPPSSPRSSPGSPKASTPPTSGTPRRCSTT